MKKNKKGWLRIVEAFTTILLIATVLIILLNKTALNEAEKAEFIIDKEYAILREIQLNDTLRGDILTPVFIGKIGWDDFESNDLDLVKQKITDRTPAQLNCEAQLCELSDDCTFDGQEKVRRGIYSRSALISATIDKYDPRRLKLFCWEVE
jgi:hypothetical protein